MKYIDDSIKSFPEMELNEVCEISHNWYYHFYGCVPPIFRNGFFMVSEPYSHVDVGNGYEPTYHACWKQNDKYYSMLVAISQASEKVLEAIRVVDRLSKFDELDDKMSAHFNSISSSVFKSIDEYYTLRKCYPKIGTAEEYYDYSYDKIFRASNNTAESRFIARARTNNIYGVEINK